MINIDLHLLHEFPEYYLPELKKQFMINEEIDNAISLLRKEGYEIKKHEPYYKVTSFCRTGSDERSYRFDINTTIPDIQFDEVMKAIEDVLNGEPKSEVKNGKYIPDKSFIERKNAQVSLVSYIYNSGLSEEEKSFLIDELQILYKNR